MRWPPGTPHRFSTTGPCPGLRSRSRPAVAFECREFVEPTLSQRIDPSLNAGSKTYILAQVIERRCAVRGRVLRWCGEADMCDALVPFMAKARFVLMAQGAISRFAIAVVVLAFAGCTDAATDASDEATCEPTELESGDGPPEMSGEGAEAWALLFEEPPWEVGQEVKVVWRMAGSGDFEVRAVGPDGEIVGPTSGPTGPRNSNWDRPGQEWGTFFNLPREGCWLLEAQRSDAISNFSIAVSG